MKSVKIEVCCGGLEDAKIAQKNGADRIELNSSLFLGGLTPSIGTMIKVREQLDIPIAAMVRPRAGGFCYTEEDFECMLLDTKMLIEHGADAIVFGILTADGKIDTERCRRFIEVIGDKDAVFHRAIDVVEDYECAIQQLISLNVKRILTSGQAPTVLEGLEKLRSAVMTADGKIGIMPGGGLNTGNVGLLSGENFSELHIYSLMSRMDNSTSLNKSIFYGGCLYPPEDRYDITDDTAISGIIRCIRQY